ncbi:MAG TPA: response regulator transcription factor, partial [Candidatus Limnocylindria bacterium]|nr:response regulator transcription factor [Candidatus Limnocylindria bacterium]
RGAVEAQQPLVVIAAARPGVDAESLLDSLPTDATRVLTLGPLDEADALALVRALDPNLDERAAARICSQARGIPFWLEGLARYGRSPGGLDQVLTRRLRGAGTEASLVLGTLALAGRPLSPAEVSEVAQLPQERVGAAIELLGARGLLTTGDGLAQPIHDLVRARAAAQVPDPVRRSIHARLAAHAESNAHGDLARLASALDHRRAAGLPPVPLAIRIATAPERRLLGPEALDALAAIADEAEPLSPETIALHAAVAALDHELGRHESALARWSLVAARAEQPALRARSALDASRAAYALGRAQEARALLERSLDLGGTDEVLALEQSTQDAAIALWLEGRGSEGRQLAARCVALAHRLKLVSDDPDRAGLTRRAVLGALRLRYEAAMQEGDLSSLLTAAEERELAASGLGLEEKLDAELALAVALRLNGRVSEAVTHLRRVWEDARRAVLPRPTVDAGFWLGRSLMVMGELEDAERIVDEAFDLARRVGDVPRARHRVARVAASIWFERGRTAAAVALLDRELGGEANEHQRIVLHADRAVWAGRLHGKTAAELVRSQLASAESCATGVECPRCTGELLQIAAEALARIGDGSAARRALQRREGIGGSGDELDRVMVAHAGALALEPIDERIDALAAAASAAAATPYRLGALWIGLDLGRAYASLGDRRAVSELDRVLRAATASGAVTIRELAARTLRTLGVRTWRRAGGGSLLTPREEEVARLVAAGVTNREVAVTLFLSPKTVERHLVNLFRKLEVRNRTELAARLAETDGKRTGFAR